MTGIWSRRELNQAPKLCQQMSWLCRLHDRDGTHIQYTINPPTKLHTQWNPVTHCCSPMALCAVWCILQTNLPSLSTTSHPKVPPVWPYFQQTQCRCWHSLKWSMTSQSSSNVSLPLAWITEPCNSHSWISLISHFMNPYFGNRSLKTALAITHSRILVLFSKSFGQTPRCSFFSFIVDNYGSAIAGQNRADVIAVTMSWNPFGYRILI